MKIAIVTQNVGFNDGQGRVNYEVAVEALRRGHEVLLCCERADAALLANHSVSAKLIPAPKWLATQLVRDQVFAWRSYRCLSRLRGGTPDVKRYDALLSNGAITWASADLNAAHFIHGSWERSPYHPWRQRRTLRSLYRLLYNRLNSMFERIAFGRSGCVVAVSSSVRRELVQIGVPDSAIVTIVNGVDFEEFRPGPGDRSAFGLPTDAVIGLFAGDLKDSRKNLDTVLRAMASVPSFHLAVAGEHRHTPWPDLAADLGVANRVHFLGFQRRMPALMRAVDFFVFPSRYETFGLVLLEALASGLPVITSRSAGGSDLIAPEVGCVLDDCEDVSTLSAALIALANAGDERSQQMSAAARACAVQHSWHDTAARYVDLLEESQLRRHHTVQQEEFQPVGLL